MADTDPLEERLTAHLGRVAEAAPPVGLAERAINHATRADEPRPSRALYGVVMAIVAVTILVVLVTTGHQTNNVFSNISNGLAS